MPSRIRLPGGTQPIPREAWAGSIGNSVEIIKHGFAGATLKFDTVAQPPKLPEKDRYLLSAAGLGDIATRLDGFGIFVADTDSAVVDMPPANYTELE